MAMRKRIEKLANKICGATAMMIKMDENAPEYYVLDCIVTDEMADVGLAMELRKTQTIEQIAAKCGKSLEDTKRLAMELAMVGACIFHTENNEDVFELTVFVPGVMEKVVGNKELCEKFPQIPKAFDEYAMLRGEMLSSKMPIGMGPMRVIPIQSALDGDSHSASYEEISTIMEKNTLFAVADCSCRRSRRLLGEGCGFLEKDMCIQLGIGAEYYIRTGRAREITKEEAYAIIKKAEDNGCMHQIPNIDGPGNTHAICNCDGNSCYSLRNASYFRSPDMVRSNYIAEVDAEKCVACGQCVEYCPVNAIQLGQKLCTITPIEVKKEESPRDHIWGEKHYNPDYRDNRTDVAETGTAPCKAECPANIAVQGYIKLASLGKYTEALELIKKENPFPAICGRVCPRKCEAVCTRGDIDDPLAIDEIKKFIAEQDLNKDVRFIPVKKYELDKSIAVIGAGPAGLSCAYFLAVQGYKVTVFEKQKVLGGMLTLGIPSFRLEKNIINAEIDVLRELGVKFETGVEVGTDVTLDQLRERGYEAFYIGIGAQAGRKLGIEGEDAQGVISGVDFQREVNLGNKVEVTGKVVVIGGGNVAIDVARNATRIETDTVNLFCLETREQMPALDEEIEEAESEHIVINNSWGPKRIVTENGKVTGVEFKKCLSVFDADGRFNPSYDEDDIRFEAADAVLVSVGQSIVWGNLIQGTKVELNSNKTVQADAFTYQTDEPDIFTGGDVLTGPKFAIDAIAAGKQGAESIHRYVWEGQSLIHGRDRRDYHTLDKDNLVIKSYDETPRQSVRYATESTPKYADPRITFTEEQVKKETDRCLGCGVAIVNQEVCVGCGMCTTKCGFDAIKLVRTYDKGGCTYEQLPIKLATNAVRRVGATAARVIASPFTSKK